MTYFLDANIISYLLKGNAAVLKKLEELAEDDNQFGIKTTKQYFANALRIGGAAEPFRSVAEQWSAGARNPGKPDPRKRGTPVFGEISWRTCYFSVISGGVWLSGCGSGGFLVCAGRFCGRL